VSRAGVSCSPLTHVQTWVLIPVAYFGELWGSPKYPVMSNQVFAQNGTKYPFNKMRECLAKCDNWLMRSLYRQPRPTTAQRDHGESA